MRAKKRIEEYGHPRGMLGKHHSKEVRLKMSKARKGKKQSETWVKNRLESRYRNYGTYGPVNVVNPYSRARGGKRADLKSMYFRSSWEANYARFLNFVKEQWEYEPRVFFFEEIKRGTRSYTPDFYLPKKDRWVEVKGWLDSKSKVRLKRFRKYYPEEFEKLVVVVRNFKCNQHAELLGMGFKENQFEFISEIEEKVGGLIKYWE